MRYIFTAFISLMFVGCTAQPKAPIVVTEYKYQTVSIPDTLLETCEVTPPPKKSLYMKGFGEEKESLLVNYIQDLLTDMDNCNSKLSQIKSIHKQYNDTYLKQ